MVRILRFASPVVPAVPVALAASCSDAAPSILDPAGPGARRVTELWWPMLAIAAGVLLVVVAMVAVALRRPGRLGEPPHDAPTRWGNRFVVVAGVVLPWLILTGVFVFSLRVMAGTGGGSRTGPGAEPLEILVAGHTWWWEIRYPNGAATANEIHVPSGQPVVLRLSTDDVLHSLWVPQLQVKLDMVPGRVNDLVIEADRPGRYRGQCAEYCGLQHARMSFYVIAQPAEEFAEWAASLGRAAAEPASAGARTGRDVFMRSSCFGCHTIRGTPARATLGPDLTHLASRETIGAATLPLTRDNLARFILDPQAVKPGAMMPPTGFSSSEIEALLDYLMDLR
jgi:cytochrome c oxidase subunit 2